MQDSKILASDMGFRHEVGLDSVIFSKMPGIIGPIDAANAQIY